MSIEVMSRCNMAHTSGIYQIRNTLNGKLYIGSSVSITRRWKLHKSQLKRGNHHSTHLQRAYNKYGVEAFEYSVLLYCSKKDLLFYEQRAMDTLKPEYNKSKVAGSCLGVKRSEETKAKNALMAKGNTNFKGKTHTQEAKDKCSTAKIGNQYALGATRSEETRVRMSKPKSPETRAKMSAALVIRHSRKKVA